MQSQQGKSVFIGDLEKNSVKIIFIYKLLLVLSNVSRCAYCGEKQKYLFSNDHLFNITEVCWNLMG